MKKILVTGASGFIGQNLITHLQDKYQIICLSRKKTTTNNPNIKYIQGDLFSSKIKKLKNIDIVIHLAAIKYNIKDYRQMKHINVSGTNRLIRLFPKSHFIYISTWLATYPSKSGYYGQTKKEAEIEVIKSKANYTILRIPHVYQNRFLSQLTIKYILPIYLLIRYHIKPIYSPVDVNEISLMIKNILKKKKFFKRSFFVKDKITLVPYHT